VHSFGGASSCALRLLPRSASPFRCRLARVCVDRQPDTDASGERNLCARALLADWADGRIDRTYPIRCYREAMKTLPADLEVYSSAREDIASALRDRIVQRRTDAARRQSP
jgi:hypothetical protein